MLQGVYRLKDLNTVQFNVSDVNDIPKVHLQTVRSECSNIKANNTKLDIPTLRYFKGFSDEGYFENTTDGLTFIFNKSIYDVKLSDKLEFVENLGRYKIYRLDIDADAHNLDDYFTPVQHLSFPNTYIDCGDYIYLCLVSVPDLKITLAKHSAQTEVIKLDNIFQVGLNTIEANNTLIDATLKYKFTNNSEVDINIEFDAEDVKDVTSNIR